MGYIYYYKEEYEESIKWYERCLKMDGNMFKGQLGMANSYYYMEKYPEAIKWYFKCLEGDKNNGQVH